MTPGKQSSGETNKLFGVKEGTALGVGEAAEKTRETKTHARRASEGPGSALASPRGPPGSAATGPMTTPQASSDGSRQQVSAGVTPSGQAFLPPPLCPDSQKPLYISFIMIIWYTYWFHCLLDCHLPQQVVPR